MRKQFTLIEILVSIVVLATLAGIAYINMKPVQEKALTSMIESNIRNTQTAVDKYRFDRNMAFPTSVVPTVGNPQEVDMDRLYPENITKKPDLSKEKSQKYWVDVFGKVWGSTVDAPSGYLQTEDYLEWKIDPNAEAYQVYTAPSRKVEGNAKEPTLRRIASMRVTGGADRMKFKTGGKDVLVSAIDKYGLETVPTGLDYGGPQQDWFSPLLSKEGVFSFEIKSFDMMYWDGFRSIEDTPEGTSITFTFSVLGEDGKFTPYTTDFYTLPPSEHLKMKVELKGHNGKYPALYDMRVFYHYANQSKDIVQTDRVSASNTQYDGTAVDPKLPIRVVDEFTMMPGMKLDDITHSDSYSIGNAPQTIYTYSQDGENFIPVTSFDKIPEGSIVRVERNYTHGSNVVIRDLIVKQSDKIVVQDGNNSPVYSGGSSVTDGFESTPTKPTPETTDPVISQPAWKTVNTMHFIAHSGNGQKTRWLRAEIEDTVTDDVNTRIIYRYSGSNGGVWSTQTDSLSVLAPYQSVRLSAYIQVLKTQVGKVDEPTVEAVRIYNEQGASDLSLVKPTVRVKPIKSNNANSDQFSVATVVDWTYEAFDPRGREIIDVEWSGDKKEQYTVGTYSVKVRVKNASNYWSDWSVFNFTVKEEKPTAIIKSSPDSIFVNTPVTWSHSSSFDPDGDGIAKSEWAGDKYSSYEETGTYTVRLRVQDKEGNWSNWTEKTFDVLPPSKNIYRVEGEDLTKVSLSIGYNATAIEQSGTSASEGKYLYLKGYSSSYYSSASHSFNGTGFDLRLYASKGTLVYLDGSHIETVTNGGWYTLSRRDLSLSTHSIRITAPNTDAYTRFDYIDVYSSNLTPQISGVKTHSVDSRNVESNNPNPIIVASLENKTRTHFVLSKNSFVSTYISDESGEKIRTLSNQRFLTGGTRDKHSIEWDGRDENGDLVPTGSYNLVIEAKDILQETSTKATQSIFVDGDFPLYRVEGEDSTKFSRYIGNNATVSELSDNSASGGKYLYMKGYSSSYSAYATHSFNGTGFDIRLYSSKGTQIFLDNSLIDTIDNGGWYTVSRRNLSSSNHSIRVSAPNTDAYTRFDYIDIYKN